MASLNKRDGRWYLTFTDSRRQPSRKKVALGLLSAKAAKRLKQRLEDEFALGEFDPWSESNSIRLPRVLSLFLESRSRLAETSQRNYRDHCGWLEDFFGDVAFASLDDRDIGRYLSSRKLNDTSAHTYLQHLRVLWRWAYKRGWTSRVYTDEVRLPAKPSLVPKGLTDEQVERICETVSNMVANNPRATRFGNPSWLIGVTRCNAYIGARRTAFTQLRWEDYDEREQTLLIDRAKGQKSRVIPIVPQLRVEIDKLPRRTEFMFGTSVSPGAISPRYLSQIFKEYAVRAGYHDISFHNLRHTAATRLALLGVPPEAIRRYMGHSTIVTTQRYTHLSPGSYMSAIRRAHENSE